MQFAVQRATSSTLPTASPPPPHPPSFIPSPAPHPRWLPAYLRSLSRSQLFDLASHACGIRSAGLKCQTPKTNVGFCNLCCPPPGKLLHQSVPQFLVHRYHLSIPVLEVPHLPPPTHHHHHNCDERVLGATSKTKSRCVPNGVRLKALCSCRQQN